MPALLRLFVALAASLALAACTAEPAVPMTPIDDAAVRAESTPPPPDMVDLTVYFRHGSGPDAYLTPVKRDVQVSHELPRTALRMLLRGPGSGDPRALRPAVPRTTRLLHLSIRDGTADVRLSREIVADAKNIGKTPEHEAIALASIANTMTEFPDISRVRMTVQGQPDGAFWGGWGLPPVLVRDESIIEPQHRAPHVASLEGFSAKRQRVGVPQRRAPKVGEVRVQSQTTYVRVTVEVTAANGDELSGPVPPTRARRAGKRVVMKVHGEPGKASAGDLLDKLKDPAVKAARVDVRGKPDQVVVALRPARPAEFKLHTLSKPARVVLDIRR